MARPSFPANLREFQRQFATEEACHQYLAACRWPEGFSCPRCGHRRAYAMRKRPRWLCVGCRYQVSLTAGTILHNTKLPLTVWFWVAYLMTTDKRGISALLIQRQLGLRRYETAWMLLHKLRRAMVNLAREPLYGDVEIDDTWVGGHQAGLRGSRQLKGRKAAIVVAAVENRGGVSGRVRMAVIPNFKQTTMIAFVKQHVRPGSIVHTDGLKGFEELQAAGVKHVRRTQPRQGALLKGAPSVVPLADRVIGNLQQWLIVCMANYKLLKDFAIRQAGSCRPSMSRIERSGSTIEAAHPAKATRNPQCGRLPAAAECADGSPRRRGRTVCRISIALPYARLAALDG